MNNLILMNHEIFWKMFALNRSSLHNIVRIFTWNMFCYNQPSTIYHEKIIKYLQIHN